MPTATGRRPCRFCRRWFKVDPRLKDRQYACSRPECQAKRHEANAAAWLDRNPGYFRGRGEKHRLYRSEHPGAQRRWRAAHPEVRERERRARAARRRTAKVRRAVEQDSIALQLIEEPGVTPRLPAAGEHDARRAQLHVLIGLAARLCPAGEHDAIARALASCHDHGRRLLGGMHGHAKARNTRDG